jgi:AraC-like DNA-binding protein
MIAGTYFLAGGLLAVSAFLFKAGLLNATTETLCWCVIFFFASAGASAAYLTVSEIFPVEVRAKAIAVFFAVAQCFGTLGPWLYGRLIGDGSDHFQLFLGYMLGALVMIVGAVVEAFSESTPSSVRSKMWLSRSACRPPDGRTTPQPLRDMISRVTGRTTRAPHLSDLARLRRVRDRIDREYAQPLDVEALARGAHMSAGHLSREFRLAYGESPYSYLMTRRIERAMALLRRGDLSVTEVCFTVGCSSLGTFSTRFTELVGVPPSTYRREAAGATAGMPSCVAKQVTRPVRNREARSPART